jgi:hypothetical protein
MVGGGVRMGTVCQPRGLVASMRHASRMREMPPKNCRWQASNPSALTDPRLPLRCQGRVARHRSRRTAMDKGSSLKTVNALVVAGLLAAAPVLAATPDTDQLARRLVTAAAV